MILFDHMVALALFLQSILAQVALIPVALGLVYLLIALRGD